MAEEWREYNTRCCVKVGGTVYPIPVSQLTIRMVPRLDGGPSFVTDISGVRRSNFKNRQHYLDTELSWAELGMQANEYYELVNALYNNIGVAGQDIYFCATYPYNVAYAIQSIPEISNELLALVWNDQMREEPGSMKFYGVNPTDSIPAWMLGNIPSASQQGVVDTDPLAWFAIDEITGLAHGNAIASWPDKSGNGWTATAAAGFEPTYHENVAFGKPGSWHVYPAGGNPDYLQTNLIPGWTENYSLAVVFRSDDSFGSGAIANTPHDSLGSAAYHRGSFDLANTGGRAVFGDDTNYRIADGRNGGPLTVGAVYHVIHRKRTGAIPDMWIDGSSLTPHDAEGTATSAAGVDRRIRLGSGLNQGYVFEVIYWQRSLTDVEVGNVINYLNGRWT